MGESAEEVIGRELGRGERLLWSGRPPFGLCLRRSDWLTIPLALFITGVSVSWAAAALAGGMGIAGGLFGSIFAAGGVWMLVARFWYAPWSRRRTWYGVTPERVVVVADGVWGLRVHSIFLRLVAEVRLTEWRDGGGLIGFGAPPPYWYTGDHWSSGNYPGLVSMELGSESRQVFDLIRDAQRGASEAEPGAGRIEVLRDP
ncbi:MAG: hypothetical protein K2X82_29305 [Gemmataceae bacterium]|nr:hypothetical protein [Gemmataceae bacterium]